MALDWLVLVAGLAVLAYVLTQSRDLAGRPRRGTEWRPTRRMWAVVVGGAAVLAVVGSVINLIRG